MKKLCAALLLTLSASALAIDVGTIYNMPNPAAHNSSVGALTVSLGGTTNYYTTTGDKQVLVGAGELKRLYNASGTSITAIIYDDADGTCNSNARTGTMALTNGTVYELGIEVTNGVCITVAGTSPTLTTVSLP